MATQDGPQRRCSSALGCGVSKVLHKSAFFLISSSCPDTAGQEGDTAHREGGMTPLAEGKAGKQGLLCHMAAAECNIASQGAKGLASLKHSKDSVPPWSPGELYVHAACTRSGLQMTPTDP